jgi:4,5-DOPA dioxygenase extradiol
LNCKSFYGFPDHYYKAQYPSRGDPALAEKVKGLLAGAGIKSNGMKRGLDHGVWAGFHVGKVTPQIRRRLCQSLQTNFMISNPAPKAFHPEENPLTVPLVQVSLFKTEDPDQHYRLGAAVASLREENIVIIGAGMSVHNLRDYGLTLDNGGAALPYTVSFDNALKEAVEASPANRQKRMAEVCKRPDAKQAHPWMDHLMPVHVAAGAAGADKGKQLWTLHEGSMGWAQYRFGEVPA